MSKTGGPAVVNHEGQALHGGYSGSSGTYASPAFKIPRRPTTISSDRFMQMPRPAFGPYAERPKAMGELVGALVQLAVG